MGSASIKIESFLIGASAKFQIILPQNTFSSCTDIIANVVSIGQDQQIISKNKKIPQAGYKTLVVDTTNQNAFWVYIEAAESAKAYKGVYCCELELIIPDNTYPSGARTEKSKFPVLNFE